MNFQLAQPSATLATQQTATLNYIAPNVPPPVKLAQTSEKLVTVKNVSNALKDIH